MGLKPVEHDPNLDLDTNTKGITGPFEIWEGDHTAFVHVLWHADGQGWGLRGEGGDQTATAIRRSRAMAAYTAFARRDALNDAAKKVAALGETVTRDEIVALLEQLAEAEIAAPKED